MENQNKKRISDGQITIWGKSQCSYEYTNGIREYHTSGHGGFFVKKKLREKMPTHLVNADGWYEEDLECVKVIIAFPEMFRPDQVDTAKETYANWFKADGTYRERE